MSCKESNICFEPVNVKCIEVNNIPSQNTLIDSECIDQEMVNEDLYTLVDTNIASLNTSELGSLSITFPTTEGKILFKEVIKKYEEEIDILKTKVTNLENKNYCDIDITGCSIDFGILSDQCDNPITTLGEALQALFNQHNQ